MMVEAALRHAMPDTESPIPVCRCATTLDGRLMVAVPAEAKIAVTGPMLMPQMDEHHGPAGESMTTLAP
jgi:hypothetical protein